MTLTAKILCQHALGLERPWVTAGDLLRIKVDWTIASELAWNGMDRTYEDLGRPELHDRERFYLAIDHTVDPTTLAEDPRAQRLSRLSQQFAKSANIRHFFDNNETILHTSFYRDLVRPGDVVLGADSHTSSHGGMGAFAIGLGGADVTVAMVLGETWIEVPEAIVVEYQGHAPFGLSGKDVILKTLGQLGRNTVALERSVEYRGDAVASFSADTRFTICNMTAEFGGLNGIFAPDGTIAAYLETRDGNEYRGGTYFASDPDAPYLDRFQVDLKNLKPQVAKPFSPDNVVDIDAVMQTDLQGAFIGACTTTEEELVLAALVLEKMLAEGQTPVPCEKRLIVPGNLEISRRLRQSGLAAIYERAGFRIGVPGCSMCLGVASDRADEGEVWLSSQNRNFANRMGKGSLAWLASAATVASSSLSMKILDPRRYLDQVDRSKLRDLCRASVGQPSSYTLSEPTPAIAANTPTAPSPTTAKGQASETLHARVQCFGDHVDTDAIIPGEFCHLTDLDELGKRCFAHVRPDFLARVKAGESIIVAGNGWGSGSSREQAVWALKGAGIQAVVARSFAFIHKRNLVNDAVPFLVITDDGFYQAIRDGEPLTVDLGRGVAIVGQQQFPAQKPSAMVSAIASAGGIVPAVREYGAQTFGRLQSRIG